MRAAIMLVVLFVLGVAQAQTRAVDGDTLVLDGRRVRLAALDCPELHQPGGREAKAHLMALVRARKLVCAFSGRDRYRRLIGHCFVAVGPSYEVLNSLTCRMIQSGLCKRYERYDRKGLYAACK